jgi:hypothetical protein
VAHEFVRVRCTSCAALVRVPRVNGSHACSECGVSLAVRLKQQAEADPEPSPSADERAAHTAERARISREVSRLGGRLKFLRWVYLLGALSSLVGLLRELMALADPVQSLPMGLSMVGLSLLTLLIWGSATLLVLQQPVLWSMFSAVTATLKLAFIALGASLEGWTTPVLVFLVLYASWTALMWWIVASAFQYRRLALAHPDLYAVQLQTDSVRRRKPEAMSAEDWTERMREKQLQTRKRAMQRAGIASGALVVASAVAAFAVVAMLRPPSLDAAAQRFREAWMLEDANKIAALASAPRRDVVHRRLASVATTRGWIETWPALVESARSVEPARAVLQYLKEGEMIQVEWSLLDDRWQISAIELPWPTADGAIRAFLEAWASAKPEQIAGLFAPESRAKAQAGLERQADKRNWNGKYPTLESTDARRVDDARFEVNFLYDGGALGVRWRLDPDDRWMLSSIEWPRER